MQAPPPPGHPGHPGQTSDADASLLAGVCDHVGCDSHALRWQFIGSALGPCRVWQVSGSEPGPGVVVKQFRNDRAFHQERHAYARWLPHLSEETAPLLAAFAAPVRALVLGVVPGRPLAGAVATPDSERAAHERAGRFLRALHDLREPDRDPLPLAAAISQRYAAWLARVRPTVDATTHARLAAFTALADDPRLFAGARRVPCHRDFTPGNWLVSGSDSDGPILTLDSFFVIDFEHAHLDTPLLDMVKLWTEVWGTRPDLEAAFFAGYGRTLNPQEQRQLSVLAAMHAMATVSWADEHADLQFAAAGRQALRRVFDSL
ncbi:MAG TPA: aminoglycoside phosphotransferase family protein [Nannocystis sp.]